MANSLESLTLSASSLKPTLSPLITSSISSFYRSSVRLPESRGLKLRFSTRTCTTPRAVGSVVRSKRARSGIIICEAQDTAVEVLAVNDQTWKSMVLESESPVLVEFWAPWCGPCRMMHPVVDAIAREYVGKVKCYKLNTDDSPSVATQYGIRSIPTVMIFKDGEKKDTIIGAVPQSTLTTSIDKFL